MGVNNLEGRLEYGINQTNHDAYIDLAKGVSAVCSKGYGSTDKKGNLLTFVCDFEFITTGTNELAIYTAKENWVTKNAFKKWHALREFMFKESGLTRKERGKYAGIIRPAFDGIHSAHYNNLTYNLQPLEEHFDPGDPPDHTKDDWSWSAAGNMDGGEWGGAGGATAVPTQIVVETDPDSGTPGVNETQQFALHICGPNLDDATGIIDTDQVWDRVGMICSYMADRSHPTPDPDDPVDYRDNPLALLKGRSETSYETAGIAADQADLEPPYDTATFGDMQNPVLGGFLTTTASGQQITRAYGVRVPAGVCMISNSAICDFRVIVRRVELARA